LITNHKIVSKAKFFLITKLIIFFYLILLYACIHLFVCCLFIMFVFFYRESSSFINLFYISWLNQLKRRRKKNAEVVKIILIHAHTSSRTYCLSIFLFVFFSLKRLPICIRNDWFLTPNRLLLITYVKTEEKKIGFFFPIGTVTNHQKTKNSLWFLTTPNHLCFPLVILIIYLFVFNKDHYLNNLRIFSYSRKKKSTINLFLTRCMITSY
jgi:hypothetical protein